MSQLYKETFGETTPNRQQLREFLQPQFPKDEDGNLIYLTEQGHKKQTDINSIITKYHKTGLITHVSKFEAQYGDMTGLDFKTMADQVAHARSLFEELPAKIRKRFDHSPEKLMTFMEDGRNREEAVELGLINKYWPEDKDGLGEHVKVPLHPTEPPPDPEPEPPETP